MKYTFTDKEIEKIINTKVASVRVKEQKDTAVYLSEEKIKQIIIAVPEPTKFTWRKAILLAREVVTRAKAEKVKKIAIVFDDFLFEKMEKTPAEIAQMLATNFEMANYEFNQYKTKSKEEMRGVEEVVVTGSIDAKIKQGFTRGKIIGVETNKTRSLSNTPGGDMTPAILANKARVAVKGTSIKVKVLGEKDMQKLKMNCILSVGKGSPAESKFIIMEYFGGSKTDAPIVLVGKGITFDTGGLDIKYSPHMLEMQMDMSGGAAVIHALVASAKLKVKRNIVALIPAAENAVSGSSYRPGDVIKSMSGKTIEVINTDAEGRLVLADGLTYAKKFKPQLVMDVATLTGASLVALGDQYSAVLTENKKISDAVCEAGENGW
jgi:leucyl aminopeptidase